MAYIEKQKLVESGYTSLLKERDNLKNEHQNLTFKLSAAAAEREKQSAEYQGSLSILEDKFKELESRQVGGDATFVAAPREIVREVYINKTVEVPVEIIKEVEVIKEVFVDKIIEVEKTVEIEVIREIEVTREIDMNALMTMLGQMGTVEVSRTTRDAEKVEAIEAIPAVEAIAAVTLETRKDDITIVEGIGSK